MLLDDLQEVVGGVGGYGNRCIGHPIVVSHTVGFTEVGECHHIACLIVAAAFVGDPHFHTGDVYTGGHKRHFGCEPVVILVEIL